MKLVYSSISSPEVYNRRNVLEAEGIECQVRGEERHNAMGELPVFDCRVELWILDDSQAARAARVLEAESISERPAWTCSLCDEELEGQFDQCWQCETPRLPS